MPLQQTLSVSTNIMEELGVSLKSMHLPASVFLRMTEKRKKKKMID
jgi:hypothetical protein